MCSVTKGMIGAVTFWGSLVAFGKLQEILPGKPLQFAGQRFLNGLLLTATIALAAWLVVRPDEFGIYLALVVVASILGVTSVVAIGGA